MKKLLLTTAALVTFAMPSFAQDTAVKYDFDKVHTQIVFHVNHVGFSNSYGKFHDFDGHFTFDKEHPENSIIDVTIKTASIDMGDATWDEHMESENFFNVTKFPDMTFKSTGVAVTGENTADITGDLTILGVTKPAVLKVTHNKTDKNPFSGKDTSGFSATATIKRSDYGMSYGLPAVGDDVNIIIEVEASPAEAAEAPKE